MSKTELNVVTGALTYSGKYIAKLLLAKGKKVRTLTGHPKRKNPFRDKLEVAPLDFSNQAELIKNLRGATTLYNTYWIRFPHGEMTFERAVENTMKLIESAEKAGVRRLVHISIANASEQSFLPYFKGKGVLERAVVNSKMSHAIIRPTVLFGGEPGEDILINNITWLLRRYPVFTIFGKGDYLVQPVHVKDLAELAVGAGEKRENVSIDAVGLETYSFEEMVHLIADEIGSKSKIIHISPRLALFQAKLLSARVKDVLITKDEIEGLMANLLVSDAEPTGSTLFSEWLRHHSDTLGMIYSSELVRHYQ